jgi:hypothetical protein
VTVPIVEGKEAPTELALNLHWSWNHAADELWKQPRRRTIGGDSESLGHPADCVPGLDQGRISGAGVSSASQQDQDWLEAERETRSSPAEHPKLT